MSALTASWTKSKTTQRRLRDLLAYILLPLTKPVLATIAIFAFINVWTDFVKQVIFLSQDSTYTVAIGLAFLRWQIAQGDPVPGLLMAATVFTSLPMIAVFVIGQKYMVRGNALTGRTGT